jgi:hypothetical protein
MSYIIAHIKINTDKTYSVDIVDDEPIAKTGLKETIDSGETDFYIKILVDQCINIQNDCFGLSNGKSYRLDFDNTDFNNRVPIDAFLSGSLANSASPIINSTGPDTNIKSNLSNVSPVQSSLDHFKTLIAEKLREVGGLDIFKKLIVKELESVVKPKLITDEATPEAKPKLITDISLEAKP